MSAEKDEYATSGSGKNDPVPVAKDEDVEDAVPEEQDPNPDATLQQDEKEAIDKSNIVNDRTRGAAPPGGYREPGDEEGIPADDGKSANA